MSLKMCLTITAIECVHAEFLGTVLNAFCVLFPLGVKTALPDRHHLNSSGNQGTEK